MTVLELARRDSKRIQEVGGYQTSLTFVHGLVTATISGTAFVHHLVFDAENNPINSKHAHITISEKSLTDLGYPTRATSGNLFMKDHLVTFTDSTGTAKTYKVNENHADETIGTITLILSNYGG